jgi:hypothetical protein
MDNNSATSKVLSNPVSENGRTGIKPVYKTNDFALYRTCLQFVH